MDRDQLRSLLSDVADRTRSIDEALIALRDMPYERRHGGRNRSSSFTADRRAGSGVRRK